MIDVKTELCCVIGNPIAQSISPLIHNAAYKALGLNYVFLAFQVVSVKEALEGLRAINVAGISVTIPHKHEVMKYLDDLDEVAKNIGAVNTIVNRNGKLFGTNTDWVGALQALEEKTSLKGKTIALLGAGGAARALAFGLKQKNTVVHVFNRTKEHGDKLKEVFNLDGSHLLNELAVISGMDIIINTTSVGMTPNVENSPIPAECIRARQIVFDVVFTPKDTKLLQYAKKKKAQIVYGYKMLLYQAIPQFELFTGKKAPAEIMEKGLLENLK